MLVPCFLGDLMVTCWSTHSRNRALGEAVACGILPSEHCTAEGEVAEGYYSAAAIHRVAKRNLPIAQAVYRILYEKSDPRAEIDALINNVF
jgi:glycerol-3-phosphate dehydrogenase (NAD(P)+)